MALTICSRTYEEFLKEVAGFHTYAAPGVVIGGFMVDLAYQNLPEDGLFDAISETDKCLPDSIQLLTPCTIGNGWLRVINTGRYALIIYDKKTGEGVRVYIDPEKVQPWSEIKSWFFKLKAKKDQDDDLLIKQIREAGTSLCGVRHVKVDIKSLKNRHDYVYSVCPECKKFYLCAEGSTCLSCQGKLHFYDDRDPGPVSSV